MNNHTYPFFPGVSNFCIVSAIFSLPYAAVTNFLLKFSLVFPSLEPSFADTKKQMNNKIMYVFFIYIIENEWSLLKERYINLISHHTFFLNKKNVILFFLMSMKRWMSATYLLLLFEIAFGMLFCNCLNFILQLGLAIGFGLVWYVDSSI